ncbi:PadR family transcriptional regulator [Streptomyces nojiriensis]|uniref:PadR family transcriptional regulator n=1 Tax=Streptomyces nojiriensis TaxID=66374 RepID=A0ABQ3T1M5_9ACTN|nr:PadR family transcriptional regulator [Streptomyces nojiriensis]QTI47778.1 Transcriptional regulator YqjI [Streptomyces nojiriensis]GGR75554.1 PadR family transcriptional regulator [Streptomyces nojiriensis]GHI74281.1 PadR family transcriptional regulator [Streptomyces nojiriensis]
MPPVFAHGRLRLYLLKLLDEAPRHGYEVIRLLEERFQGLYAPSAGTVYPRLAKLEAEGLVTHATEGGRKVYSITDAGRAELADRGGELADLEVEIRDSVTELAAEMRDDVRGAAGDLRREMRAAASASATQVEDESWKAAKEDLRKARQEWKEQARRAKDESRRAREEAQQARRQAKEAQERAREEVQRIAGQLQEQFAKSGGVLGSLAGAWLGSGAQGASPAGAADADVSADGDWAADLASTGDPARDLDRLLDRFRDEVRDAARDRGVTAAQVAEARGHLKAASGRLGATFGARS